jgi:hypothetical protein
MSNHKNLVFFNKEGDYLNVKYNLSSDRFEGDILFHQSSSDVYKTYGIYTMEYLPAFEYAMPGDLTLKKFQVFNEWGMHFYAGRTGSHIMDRIEPVNNDPSFYSKWVYGENFEILFPIGSFIIFENKFIEFTDTKKTYAVIGSKKGAVMILSDVDNATFESMYMNDYMFGAFPQIRLRGANLIGVYNYIDAEYRNNLAEWNEPSFYERYYNGKKLNVVNSEMNDGTYTVKDYEVTDAVHFEYQVTNLPTDKPLIIEAISRTDVPKIYDGGLKIGDGQIRFTKPDGFPFILKPGREFKIIGSQLNTNFFSVSDITNFEGISSITTFYVDSQVIYKNRIFQCKKTYVQDFSDPVYGKITPENEDYWGLPNFVRVNEPTSEEILASSQMYLTTDRIYFEQAFTQSSSMTLAFAAEKYKYDLQALNIDLYAERGVLRADLMYSSNYAEVNFYHTDTVRSCLANLGDRESYIVAKAIEILGKPNDTISSSSLNSSEYLQLSTMYDAEVATCESYKIGTKKQTNERLVEVKEQLRQELNYDYSENFRYNIVFTDIDEYGIKIVVNKQVYEEEVAWLYSGAAPDMERTIDRTLRNWLTRNYKRLYDLGIIAELDYLGTYVSPFYNSIVLKTEYPNVPIEINRVEVGTTADYHIEHSKVIFNEIGSNLAITINSRPYEMQTLYGTYLDSTGSVVSATSASASVKLPDIAATLEAWVEEHAPVLETYGIIVKNINNLLKFDIKRTDRRLDYTIKTGKVLLPGQTDFIRTDKIKGNIGTIITGNEINLVKADSEASFEDAGFGTGRVISINNTPHPLQDIKYNLLMVDPKALSISYQGPFWGLEKNPCRSSAFITLAFNIGFGQTTCIPPGLTGVGGPFNPIQHNDQMFGVAFNPNDYIIDNFSLDGKPGVSNLVDMKYIQLANAVFILGDNLIAVDALSGIYLTTIYLTGNTDSIEMEFNTFNNYLYCLSKTKLWAVDPVMNTIKANITLTSEGADMAINPENGDIYVTYKNSATITIFDSDNALVNNLTTPSALDTRTGKMVFNDFEKDMYVTTDAELLLRINGSTRTLQTSYNIPGLTQSGIFYEPVFEAIYVYSQTQLWKVDNGLTYSISGVTSSGGISDVVFNNLTGSMNISESTYKFKSLSLDTDSVSINTNIATYGKLALNQYDGGMYVASTDNKVVIVDSANGMVVKTEITQAPNTRILYNPERKVMWTLQPSIKNIFEIKSIVNSEIDEEEQENTLIEEGKFGTLDPNYVKPADVWVKAYECVRKPRENFEGEVAVKYYWKWLDNTTGEFFIYDLSGDMLEKTGPYAYLGPKPFQEVPLNKYPNRDIEKIYSPEYQQTVFDRVEYELSYIDDQDDVSIEPSPLQLFLGFKAPEEGSYTTSLQLFKKEAIEYSITSTPTNDTTVTIETIFIDGIKKGRLKINAMSEETFTGKGFKPDQYVAIYINDVTNTKNKYISPNNGYYAYIEEIYTNTMILGFVNPNIDFFESESTVVSGYPNSSTTTYLKITLSVIDREIGRFRLLGQTEIEDVRFKTELGNNGKLIGPNEIFIFKDYDIFEGGIDWTFLNMKRKELLMMKNLIYPYIGSYKSIINAINFFGYNDLQLNEYYRNVDVSSENFSKLFKVEIPDIFDNTVEGWTENDFIKHTFPNERFEETNLLNLTYFITDKEGNNKLNYSIDEVTIKLQGLKHWLKKNIIPLTHKILDITGRSYFTSGSQITHRVHDIRIVDIKENMTPISCKLNEVYLMPVNSGSTVYNCVLDFYAILEGIGADKNPTGLIPPPRPYNELKKEIRLPEYFTIKIRTYKTYKEWAPFATYMKGDKVTYYGKVYESKIDNNKIKSPRKYEDAPEWSANETYDVTNLVQYNREIFVYSGLGGTYSSIVPVLDQGDDKNWLNITEWMEIDFEPVQTINEYRRIPAPPKAGLTMSIVTMAENGPHQPLPVAPFNFTIDSNIDPFITIEVSSENGYGSVYRDRKNYEIRGLKDLTEPMRPLDVIGPFIPITPIE